MRAVRRILVAIAAAFVVASLFGGGPAWAQDLSDTPDGALGWEIDDLDLPAGQAVGTAGFCKDIPQHTQTEGTELHSYKSFTSKADGQTHELDLDEYHPPLFLEPLPAMVLVHGGGWARGCRQAVGSEARVFSNNVGGVPMEQPFFVFSIDHRLACKAGDFPGGQVYPLCGWKYKHNDGGSRGAAIHDVQDAIEWVRNDWGPDHEDDWNGKVVAVGASSGGTLVAMAAALSTPGSDSSPDAVATLSAFLEFHEMSNDHYGCDHGQTSNPPSCWKHNNNYLGCVLNGNPDDACVGAGDLYEEGSPITHYDSDILPPIFLANGGGPESPGPELVAVQEAYDFEESLVLAGFEVGAYELCIVNTPGHATGYLLDQMCDGGTEFVYQRLVDFLAGFAG